MTPPESAESALIRDEVAKLLDFWEGELRALVEIRCEHHGRLKQVVKAQHWIDTEAVNDIESAPKEVSVRLGSYAGDGKGDRQRLLRQRRRRIRVLLDDRDRESVGHGRDDRGTTRSLTSARGDVAQGFSPARPTVAQGFSPARTASFAALKGCATIMGGNP